MSSTYEKCISLYPQVLFFVLLLLCHMYHLSYAYALIGYIGNSVVNGALKQLFRSLIGQAGDRPVPHAAVGAFDDLIISIWPQHAQNRAYGFPSGHAQSIGYVSAFLHQFFWKKWHPLAIISHILIASYLLDTRISYKRHTFIQVLFGFLFGIAVFHMFHWYWTS